MKKGFDTNTNIAKYAAAIRAAGYDFVGRYYNIIDAAKNLTSAEAHILSAAGLGIVAVWENGNPTYAGHFTYDRGVYDGTCAYKYAHDEITQPASTPIYFSVDYDAAEADIQANILPYFEGVKAGFNSISQNNPVYPIGVYGSGLVCTSILASGIARYSWLSQSTGFSGSKAFEASGKANIIQGPGTTFIIDAKDQLPIDTDSSPNNNEGSFTVNMLVSA